MTGPALLIRRGRVWRPAGVLADGAVLIEGGRVAWVGESGAAPGGWDSELDAGGALVTPGLVDAHTHPVYLAPRLREVAARSAGAGYAEIAAAGGGIGATVRGTRGAAPGELAELVRERLARWPAGGATTVEAKTGYHLDRSGELAAVRLLAGLSTAGRLPRLSVTFLAAHALPPGYERTATDYLAEVSAWLPEAKAAGAAAADVFCDEGYFEVEPSRRLLESARAAGLAVRLHADELARTGGAGLAAQVGAVSADHLLRIDAGDAVALAAAGVVAVLCPVTAMGMGRLPPVAALRAAGAVLALGSDHNPGTSGITSMATVVGLAVQALGLSLEEALRAATAGGAAAVMLAGETGTLSPGEAADVVLWDADHEGAFAWQLGELRPSAVYRSGLPILGAGG
jgi:imidazolonepropionase